MKDHTARQRVRAMKRKLRVEKAVIPHLVTALQHDLGTLHEEQSKRIEALEARVQQLEARLADRPVT